MRWQPASFLGGLDNLREKMSSYIVACTSDDGVRLAMYEGPSVAAASLEDLDRHAVSAAVKVAKVPWVDLASRSFRGGQHLCANLIEGC
jgi:hypothetical protein